MVAPVSVCLIVRNEEVRIVECLQAIRPFVKEICVVDTGSSDRTIELAKPYVDRFEEFWGCNEGGTKDGAIEDFSLARERSFALATQPWILWLDGDDVIRGAENLERIVVQYPVGNTILMFPYEYSHDHHGNCTMRLLRERLISTREGYWSLPVHETWVPKPGPIQITSREDMVWVHRRTGKVDTTPQRNLRIIKKWFEQHDGPDVDARMLYYAALEYGNVGDIAKSIELHMRYVEKSGWDDEKCLSILELVQLHQRLGNYEEMVRWATQAMLLQEHWAEPRFALARAYYFIAQRNDVHSRRNWERCINHTLQGLALPPTQTPLFINPLERRLEVHRYLNVALTSVNRLHEARSSVETGLQAAPDDPHLTFNRKYLIGLLSKIDLNRILGELIQTGDITEQQRNAIEGVLAGRFRKANPDEKLVQIQSTDLKKALSVSQVADPNRLDIVLFTGLAWERWNPTTLEKGGMGGSETMAWEMTRRLARLGHRVRVYGDCEGMEGTFEGVEWLDYRRFIDPETKSGPVCDVMISSRIAELVDYPFTAKLKIAWVHDVHMGDALTNRRALKFDRFWCLSNWHKDFFLQTYRFIHPFSVHVTRNGIDLSRYEKNTITRDPHRMIYSSSPDRGLQVAIQAMPAIRARVPSASLRVFYGFENWEKHPDQNQKNLAHAMKGMLKAYEPFGVVFYGRVSGKRLAEEQLKSGVWGYSTWFSETSCLSAMEAQAAGLRIVTSPIAALNETVGNRGVMIPGDWLSPEYISRFTDAVVEAMLKEEDGDRAALHQYAKDHFGLDELAVEWVQNFRDQIADVERDVVPRYQPAA